jgi:hypothetical protein
VSSSSFTKRQKERARQEKQRNKAEKRAQRKTEKTEGGGPPIDFSALVRYQPEDANEEPETDGNNA